MGLSKKQRKNKKHTLRKRNKKTRQNRKKSYKRGGLKLVTPFGVLRTKSIIPKCAAQPYMKSFNPTPNRPFMETYDLTSSADTNNILFELMSRPDDPNSAVTIQQIGADLHYNCPLFANFAAFWETPAQNQIIGDFNLGQPMKGQRRLVDYIIEFYKNGTDALSPDLKQAWQTIDSQRKYKYSPFDILPELQTRIVDENGNVVKLPTQIVQQLKAVQRNGEAEKLQPESKMKLDGLNKSKEIAKKLYGDLVLLRDYARLWNYDAPTKTEIIQLYSLGTDPSKQGKDGFIDFIIKMENNGGETSLSENLHSKLDEIRRN